MVAKQIRAAGAHAAARHLPQLIRACAPEVIGIALFTMVVIFQIVNLPVEFNASRRARRALLANGLTTQVEDRQIAKVLNAAAMTYVAATVMAVLTLLYYLLRSGVLGGRRQRSGLCFPAMT